MFLQDVSGYVLEERVNVPAGAVFERYTFAAGSGISSVFTICNNQASSYMLSDVCDDTAAFGINGNDAITLLDASGSAVVRSSCSWIQLHSCVTLICSVMCSQTLCDCSLAGHLVHCYV